MANISDENISDRKSLEQVGSTPPEMEHDVVPTRDVIPDTDTTRAETGAPEAKPVARTRKPRTPGKSARKTTETVTIDVPVAAGKPAEPTAESEARASLEAQGFSSDEAARLIHVSDRMSTSREVREAQATMKRLRFAQWLIEHGVIDEFSA